MPSAPVLDRAFYRRETVTVARDLLGQRLVRVLDGQRLAGLIVETEAYLGVADRAAHTFGGRRTARVASMWLDGGHAYVYFTYGMHHCVNLTAGEAGVPEAILIRSLEPTEGLDVMRGRRVKAKRDTDLCSGPGKLCEAMAIDRGLDGRDVTRGGELYVERARVAPLRDGSLRVGPRVGIGAAGEWVDRPLRFVLAGSLHVSR